MTDQPGFQVGIDFFPFVDDYKTGDPILIYEVTGWDWDKFAEQMAVEAEKADTDPGAVANPILTAAMLAVAVQRQRPHWSRKRVSEYVLGLDLNGMEIVGVDTTEDDEDGGALPPASSGASSRSSADEPNTPPDSSKDSSAEPSQNGSGDPGSAITTPASAPAT